jgi:hypothetical protein
LIISGAVILFGTLYVGIRPRWLAALLVLFGFGCALVGGFSARAQLSGLRVFGEPDWKKAKKTYKEHKGNQER